MGKWPSAWMASSPFPPQGIYYPICESVFVCVCVCMLVGLRLLFLEEECRGVALRFSGEGGRGGILLGHSQRWGLLFLLL